MSFYLLQRPKLKQSFETNPLFNLYLISFINDNFFRQLIGWTEDKSLAEWKGYLFAALFFASAVMNSFFFHQLFHIGMTLGMRVKASMIAAVYKKVCNSL